MALCPKCGVEILDTKLVMHCLGCLTKVYLERLCRWESEELVRHPNPKTAIAKAKGNPSRHLVLHADPDFTYCGLRPQGPRKNWLYERLDALPSGICAECLKALDKIRQAAHQAAGGAS